MLTRGSIYIANLPKSMNSSVQGGLRPVIVVQNDAGNAHSPTVQVIPLTSRTKKPLPIHVVVRGSACGLEKESIALTEQIQTIDKTNIHHYIGKLDDATMEKVNACILIQLGLLANTKRGGNKKWKS